MAGLSLIDWAAPGPYRVAFSTRLGGVSDGPFESLNLGIRTEDDPARVVENRIRLCDAAAADPDGATMAWQRHGSTVTRAQPRGIVMPGTVYDHCDGLWSDEQGRAMLLLTADCLPIAIARTDARTPAVGILHAGWRGLLAGIVAAGVRALGGGGLGCRDRPDHRPVLLRGRARRSRRRSRRRSATTSCATASSICGRRPSARSAPPASSTSSASTSARPAMATASSRTGATAARPGARE